MPIDAQFLYDEKGTPTHAIIGYADFQALTGEAIPSDEELYDAAKAADDGTRLSADMVSRLVEGENPIKVWREFRGMTQEGLATACGVTSDYIGMVERGARHASRKLISRMAAVLDCDRDDLEG